MNGYGGLKRSSLLFAGLALLMLPGYSAGENPDSFEPDGGHRTAREIVVSGTPQKHNFHAYYDEDWAWFYNTPDWTYGYGISVLDPGNDCDPVLEVYDSDGKSLLMVVDEFYAGEPEAIFWFDPPHTGVFYLRVRNYNPLVIGERTGYQLELTGGSFPYAPTGRVTGFVTDADSGFPIPGVEVRTNISKIGSDVTDGQGIYDIEEYSYPSPATLTAWHRLYHTRSIEVPVPDWLTTIFDFTLTAMDPPQTTVLAAGKAGSVGVTGQSPVPVTIGLDSRDRLGEAAEWWLVAAGPGGLLYLDLTTLSWLPVAIDRMLPTLTAPLMDFAGVNVSGFPGFPETASPVTVYFGVDMMVNGRLDVGRLYFDFVTITMSPR